MVKIVNTLKKLVGQRVRELRKKAGFTSAEALAEAIGMHAISIYELERGDNWISPEMMEKLCQVFGVHPSTFFIEDRLPAQKTILALAQDAKTNADPETRFRRAMENEETRSVVIASLETGIDHGIDAVLRWLQDENKRERIHSILGYDRKPTPEEALDVLREAITQPKSLPSAKRRLVEIVSNPAFNNDQAKALLSTLEAKPRRSSKKDELGDEADQAESDES